MAYTKPIQVSNNVPLGSGNLSTGKITGIGRQAPFTLPTGSGTYWAQITFQCVLGSVTTLIANLEFDITGVDANFVASPIVGVDFVARPGGPILNLNGGGIRYRWNVQSFRDGGSTGAYIYAIAG